MESMSELNLEMKSSYIPSQEQRGQGTNNTHSVARAERLFYSMSFPVTLSRKTELKAVKHTLDWNKNDVFTEAYWGLFAEPESGAKQTACHIS